MKRDMDFVRQLLIDIEEKDYGVFRPFDEYEEENKKVGYHTRLLINAGYVDGSIKETSGGGIFIINGLTWKCHAFVCYLTYPRGCKKEGVLWKPTESTPCTILTQKPSWWLPTSG
ncbi:DUF2513 domain-containing protein, partial [Meiothermus sp.]|uniref:DUF2513 domain-containing protein n=1 Tax=Meiothermus sp. TaxID=1955249 RepID=UPI00307EA71E